MKPGRIARPLVLIALLGLVSGGPITEDGVLHPFEGCQITRRTLNEPGPNVVYVVRLSPRAVEFVATPDNGPAPRETTLQTTRQFLEASGSDLAFNASFYRAEGGMAMILEPYADLCGAAVSGGQVVSQIEAAFPAVEIDSANRLSPITGRDAALEGRHLVVAGSSVLVRDGANQVTRREDVRHPRTALGATADGTLLVVLVDGRQPGRSEGMTQRELADLLVSEGAVLAINLDGGGSTTLVTRDEQGQARVLNVPMGLADRPGSERPVGFNIGVKAKVRPASRPGPPAAGR